MSDLAIRVENLSKRYTISTAGVRHDSLSEQLAHGLRSLISRNGLRSMVHGFRSTVGGQRSPREDTFWALRDVFFQVKQGEIVGIIGPNGAGKSTLLKILSRITEPTSGYVELRGRVSSLLEVGTGFDRELTGRENVYLNGAILGMKKAEIDRKFDEIVDFSGVERFIDTPVKRYSSGMFVRLAFAVAAHLEPEILIVDEVLAVGDAAFQKKCLGKMEDVAHRGRTVLFVSHNMAMIEHLCSRAVLLQNGTVAERGLTDDVISRYLQEIKANTAIPLSDRTDRQGEGELVISAIELLDQQERTVSCPASGQELVIRVHYHSMINKVFTNCKVTVTLNKDERPYILMSTEFVSRENLQLKDDGYVDFMIAELPLTEGQYYVNFCVESNDIVQDWVKGAVEIPVVDGDYYGTGRICSPGWKGKYVLIKYRCQVGGVRVL